MKKLEGKVALVTGALAERILGNGGKAKAIHPDIGNPSQAKAFVDAAVKEFGRLSW